MERRFYDYTHAMVRSLPNSFDKCITMEKPSEAIDVPLAKKQHHQYTEILKQILNENLVEVKEDERYPDCCFIEDTCVVIGSTVVINNMKAQSRTPEVEAAREALKQLNKVTLIEMKSPAVLDGGDVLVTGAGDIFVGRSSRTNEEGIEVLQKAFPRFKVKTIAVKKGLHLKSVMTALDETTLVVADTPQGHEIADIIQPQNSKQIYSFIFVPDEVASNVLRIRDTVIIQDGFPKSETILVKAIEERKLKCVKLQMSELIKGDGALTCCSVPLTL